MITLRIKKRGLGVNSELRKLDPARPVQDAQPAFEPPSELGETAAPAGFYASFMSNKTVWLASFVALGTADFGSLAQLTPASSIVLDGVGVAGGAGMLASSTTELKKSRSAEDKLDAANNLAWGGQGLMYLMPSSASALEVGLGLGLVGSAMQTAVGVMRIQRGFAGRDRSMVKLGALDVGSGLLWLAWDLVGARHPLFVSAYIAAKVGREAYANREALRGFLGSLKQRAVSTYREMTEEMRAEREGLTPLPVPLLEPQSG